MKKWMVLGAVGVLAALGVVWLGQPAETTSLETMRLSPKRVEQTVSCSGIVEASGGEPVLLPIACVVSTVEVKAGQRVEKGDVLFTVDKDATRAALQTESELVVLAAMDEKVTAPTDGVVTAMNCESGVSVNPAAPCVMIVREEDLQIRVSIREKDLPKIERGMTVRVSGDGFDRVSYAGVLEEISSAASLDSSGGATIQGVVSLEEHDSSLRIGLTARVTVITSVIENGVVVPYAAIVSDEKDSYVYTVEEGRTYRRAITGGTYVTDGVLMSDDDWRGCVIVCQPDMVSGEGMAVEVTRP